MKQDNSKEIKKQKKGVFSFFGSNKFKHGTMATVITVVFIALVVLLNVLAGILSDRFPSINIDMTAQGMNTLSEDALQAAKEAGKDTQIIILELEENISPGADYSQVINLAKRMSEVNQKIQVSFEDLDFNREFINDYPGETLARFDVIVRTDESYRILKETGDLFAARQGENGQVEYYSLVDGALANAVTAVNAGFTSKMAFAMGHNEVLTKTSRSSFEQMLKEQLFDIEEFSVMTEDIPEDTDLVVIPAPTTDYTKEEIEKLRTFLADDSGEIDKMLMYIASPGAEIPNLAEFLAEWGVEINYGVVAESDVAKVFNYNPTYIMVDSTAEIMGDTKYQYMVSPSSAPLEILFSYNDDISVNALWTTAETTFVINSSDFDVEKEPKESFTTATLSRKQMSTDGRKNANLMVFGSADAFTNLFAGTRSFGNQGFYIDLLSTLTGKDAVKNYVQPVAISQMDIMMDQKTATVIGIGVFTVGIPLCIMVAGLTVFLRRRHK